MIIISSAMSIKTQRMKIKVKILFYQILMIEIRNHLRRINLIGHLDRTWAPKIRQIAASANLILTLAHYRLHSISMYQTHPFTHQRRKRIWGLFETDLWMSTPTIKKIISQRSKPAVPTPLNKTWDQPDKANLSRRRSTHDIENENFKATKASQSTSKNKIIQMLRTWIHWVRNNQTSSCNILKLPRIKLLNQ